MLRYSLQLFNVLLFCGHSGSTELLKYLREPEFDGLNRVKTVVFDSQNVTNAFDALLQENQNGNGVVIVLGPEIRDQAGEPRNEADFPQLAAQLLEPRNVSVYQIPLVQGVSTLPEPLAQHRPGDVIFIRDGIIYPYYGRRSPLSLLSFVLKRSEGSQVKHITGKVEKMAFDKIPESKVVGFFMANSPEYKEFDIAARRLSSLMPFFVVTDRIVAKHLKLQNVGEIHLVRPYEKIHYVCSQNPASAADIEAFVNQHRGAMLTHLNEHNLMDPTILNPDGNLFLAIGEKHSPLGGYFYRLILRYIKNVTYVESEAKAATATAAPTATTLKEEEEEAKKQLAQNVTIVWIDPELFPSMHMMMDDVQKELKLPTGPLKFHFGSVNLTNNESVWFDTSLLNTTADKTADEENLELLKSWIISVLNKTIPTQKFGVQSFLKEPTHVQVEPGSDIVLECLVSNPVGECLWLKDGKNIGFNLNRYAPHYSWRSSTAKGDCSLLIKGVSVEQDAGQWVCEVSGDVRSPTITSKPATLSVVSPKTEL